MEVYNTFTVIARRDAILRLQPTMTYNENAFE
jgi:hypothetical protein